MTSERAKKGNILSQNYLFFLGKQFCRLLDKKVLFWMQNFHHISIEFFSVGEQFFTIWT
jgi:hypothetical protein